MRKQRLMQAMCISLGMLALTACGQNNATVNTPVETTSEYNTMRDSVEQETDTIGVDVNGEVDSNKSFEVLRDHKEELQQRALEQAKEGFRKLKSGVTAETTDQYDLLENGFLPEVELTSEELQGLDSEELFEVLRDAGLSNDEIYCYSIMQWLIEAQKIGDDATPEEYLTNTKLVISRFATEHDIKNLDFENMLKCRNADELYTLITGSTDEGDTDKLVALNGALYFNNLYPGQNIDTEAILEAKDVDELLDFMEDNKLTGSFLKDISNPEREEAGKFAETLIELEKQREEEKRLEELEKQKAAGGNGGTGSSGNNGTGSTSKDTATNKLNNSQTDISKIDALPEGAKEHVVSIQVANDGGIISGGSTSNKYFDNDDDSTNSKGEASIAVGDAFQTVKIVVKRVTRGSLAKGIIEQSNARLPGAFDLSEIPDDYEPVAVKFTVRVGSDDEDKTEGITVPYVRVRNLSGTLIDTVATKTYLIQPDATSYDGTERTKTYWVAFLLPESQKEFSLYFGDQGGDTYRFRSTSLKVEDDN